MSKQNNSWFRQLFGAKDSFVEVEGHRFEEKIKVGQHQLILNGTGVRTQNGTPIYALGLYLPMKTHREDTSRAMLGARRCEIAILADLNAADFIFSMREAIKENNNETSQEFIQNELLQIEEFMQELAGLIPGDTVDVDWVPARGTFVYYNGQLVGNPVRGKALYDAVLSIWLGKHALENELKNGLLDLKD